MKIVRNTGTGRVIDLLRPELQAGRHLDVVTQSMSVFAFGGLLEQIVTLARCRLVLPPVGADLALQGSEADRAARNGLQARWLARRLSQWLSGNAEVRRATGAVPQGAFVVRDATAQPLQVLLGSLALSTDGLGLTPGNPLSLIQASESPAEALLLSQWFDTQWAALASDPIAQTSLVDHLRALASHRDPWLIREDPFLT